jgi:hypothetical protein
LKVKFTIDKKSLNDGEMAYYVTYLMENLLHIDAWDADSLMSIGSALIPLKVIYTTEFVIKNIYNL